MTSLNTSIIDWLVHHSAISPAKTVFTVLKDGEELEERLSYRQLNTRVAALGSAALIKKWQGERVLLFYEDILEFIVAFLACQYAGIIPIPVPYVRGGRQFHRLVNIIDDAQARCIFCTRRSVSGLRQDMINFMGKNIEIVATDEAGNYEPASQQVHQDISFIQYTSGSTGLPKGVIITRQNLLSNQKAIKNAFGCDDHSIVFSWLPYHHDMGLIGNILHAIYTGCTCILMSPVYFMQKPERWLNAVSKYKVTHSGGPNFSYDLCVNKISRIRLRELDLSNWRVAYNGSEPVRLHTIRQFSDYFRDARFDSTAFYPCYGLAEATLLVSGSRKHKSSPGVLFIEGGYDSSRIRLADSNETGTRTIVSCGHVADDTEIKITSITDQHECPELETGEICISGGGITTGYWNKNNRDIFYQTGKTRYLRTGDLGFMYKNELFITGRLKETLIVRGINIYPYDIEELVAGHHPAIEANGVALFSIDEMQERLVIVAEIRRMLLKDIDAEAVIASIDKLVTGSTGLSIFDILLTTPLGIPRTTSGKLQRTKCTSYYRANEFNILASKRSLTKPVEIQRDPSLATIVMRDRDYQSIKKYLVNIIEESTGVPYGETIKPDREFTEIGIDSLRASQLVNTINKELFLNMDAAEIFRKNTLSTLITDIENRLWVQNTHLSGNEITI